MTQRTLTEEKEELNFRLLDIIAERDRIKVYQINIVNIIPISRGLKVVYKAITDKVRLWSRTIKYSDLANGI